jgi:hypothetical protein
MPPIRALASSGSQTVSSASSMNKPPPSVDYERVAPNEAAGSFRGVRTVRSSSWQGGVGGGSEAPSGRGRKSELEAEHPGGHVPIKAKFASERVWRPSLLRRIAHSRCHGANLKPTLIPIPFAAWYALAWFAEMLPSAPVTRNQVEPLDRGNTSGHNMGSLIRVRRDPWRASSLSFPRIRARMLIAHGTFTSLDQF